MNQQPPEQPSYLQQQPYYPPQMQPGSLPPPVQPKQRKAPIWVWITIGIMLLAVCGISNAIRTTPNGQTANSAVTTANSDTATSQPETPTPTPKPPVWTTTHTFNGNGAKKTETFTVGSD
ncbi:MAG TPA: hypothetical protein VKY19_12410 [Ktedonosporobacter sp.]|jgi:flagellar basal body-associated protein FliL|nr:hypothetical protein [Ktedonosporobacter sp.]